ncbi:hypothetical protein [Actinokineospora pegani]|uniref:hypothetical protein n=1 Tax=Actinokineospora pegani TaxID=2654637 RepID=UPI0012EA2E23|nr:hypothetical protein [Actinokineospora pegani]
MKLAHVVLTSCACVALVAGCGGAQESAAPSTTSTPLTVTEKIARSGGPASRGGERTSLGSGLAITVSTPKSFVPTATASPIAPRAVGLEVVVENEGTSAYKPAQLRLLAKVNGESTQQVIDSTQGYSGLGSTGDVEPGDSVRFSVAFAVPEDKTWIVIAATPKPDAEAVSVFSTTA